MNGWLAVELLTGGKMLVRGQDVKYLFSADGQVTDVHLTSGLEISVAAPTFDQIVNWLNGSAYCVPSGQVVVDYITQDGP